MFALPRGILTEMERVEVAVGAQWNPGETNDLQKSGSVHF
jgi:hypothetical protein